jgi:flavin reductase (DIM6/NTAB) family NADH-FMN oxidoreductase RutF
MQTVSLRSPGFDSTVFRHALGRFATGVAIVTTCTADGQREGVTVNSFTSLSLDPPMVSWSLRRSSSSLAAFNQSGRFAINVLSEAQIHLSRHFAAPHADKFESIEHMPGSEGCPIFGRCLAVYECSTDRAIEVGDHVLFIGRVKEVSFDEGAPLIYASGQYASLARTG